MARPAVAVPSGPTSCTQGRLSLAGSACPLRRGVHELHMIFLFRLSPKVAKNPRILTNDNTRAVLRRLLGFRRTRGPGELRSGGRPLAARVETARGDHVSPEGPLPTVCRAVSALLQLTGSALTCSYRAQETAP